MKYIFYLVIFFIALLGVLFLKNSNNLTPPTHIQTTTKTFELTVKNRKLVSGPTTLKVTQGDTVVIKITADENEELHVHGYDKSVDLEKDKPTELSFTAHISGRFPYELEHSKTDICALEVQPK